MSVVFKRLLGQVAFDPAPGGPRSYRVLDNPCHRVSYFSFFIFFLFRWVLTNARFCSPNSMFPLCTLLRTRIRLDLRHQSVDSKEDHTHFGQHLGQVLERCTAYPILMDQSRMITRTTSIKFSWSSPKSLSCMQVGHVPGSTSFAGPGEGIPQTIIYSQSERAMITLF